MPRELRYYSFAGLVAIFATLLMLFWFYRQVAIQGIVQLAERTNLTLARSALGSMRPDLIEFLHASTQPRANGTYGPDLPPGLAASIRSLMQDRTVVRVKLYNRAGIVVYSSRHEQIGADQHGNDGFRSAIDGRVTNNLVYRDQFNSFDGSTEDDNLMQTYLPVRASPADPIEGVFEIYTDVNNLASQTERTEFIIMLGALVILLATYGAVILVVWRAANIIEMQQRTIRERTQTLEVLSAHMLKSEESNKKKIAHELHEGLAQTLSAIKLYVENLRSGGKSDADGLQSVGAIIPVLHDAIQEVRAIATELRPSSIDDIGLLLTLQRLCRDVEQKHPPLRIDLQIPLQENDIPARLKIILYRIITSVFDDMAERANDARIGLALWRDDNNLTLLIDDTASEDLDRTAMPLANIDPQHSAGLARMEELTTLSGGEFKASHHAGGGTTLRASWSVGRDAVGDRRRA
jgi:signal transduction histidine kinase